MDNIPTRKKMSESTFKMHTNWFECPHCKYIVSAMGLYFNSGLQKCLYCQQLPYARFKHIKSR